VICPYLANTRESDLGQSSNFVIPLFAAVLLHEVRHDPVERITGTFFV
jgi:hypothetical protein